MIKITPGKKCLLCDHSGVLFPAPNHTLSVATYLQDRNFGYIHGFADGCRAVHKGLGPELCDKHRQDMQEALVNRGMRAAILQ